MLTMMTTPHLDNRRVRRSRTARELLNKPENERSGLLSTAISFLGLYRRSRRRQGHVPMWLAGR